MNKDFTKYNQSLSLKELGFEEPCFGFYTEEYKILIKNFCKYPINLPTKPFLAPTYSQAFRWMRNKYNLTHKIFRDGGWYLMFIADITNEREESPKYNSIGCKNTYEEAEQACLDKLIEIIKNKL